jgi:hypothetical protein
VPATEAPKRKPIHLSEPFRPLPVRFFELWEHNGWRVKVYGTSSQHQRPAQSLVDTAKRIAAQRLPVACDDNGAHSVGFLAIHEGRDANFVFVAWWSRENELQRYVYRSATGNPEALDDVTATGCFGTVWDLQILWFERNAWVEKVLGNARGPDIEAYLKKLLSDQA